MFWMLNKDEQQVKSGWRGRWGLRCIHQRIRFADEKKKRSLKSPEGVA
jgi:hypothetical protein